jgi:NADH-quinone oxidoreductase subunit J
MIEEIISLIPPLPQLIFLPLALFVAVCALLVAIARNLFHGALALVATLFGVAAIYAMLEAEFVAVSQILIYVGAISTLITFAIMLTRGMMFGRTTPNNRQLLAAIVVVGLLFAELLGLAYNVAWPQAETPDTIQGSATITQLGIAFVNEYLIAFELLALLLLVALSGALLLARDRK